MLNNKCPLVYTKLSFQSLFPCYLMVHSLSRALFPNLGSMSLVMMVQLSCTVKLSLLFSAVAFRNLYHFFFLPDNFPQWVLNAFISLEAKKVILLQSQVPHIEGLFIAGAPVKITDLLLLLILWFKKEPHKEGKAGGKHSLPSVVKLELEFEFEIAN